MLKVNYKSGFTETLDLFTVEGVDRWRTISEDPATASTIMAVGIHEHGMMHVMPMPTRFGRAQYEAEGVTNKEQPVAERVVCFVGDFSITLTVYKRNKLARVDTKRIGRLVHRAPLERRCGKRHNASTS